MHFWYQMITIFLETRHSYSWAFSAEKSITVLPFWLYSKVVESESWKMYFFLFSTKILKETVVELERGWTRKMWNSSFRIDLSTIFVKFNGHPSIIVDKHALVFQFLPKKLHPAAIVLWWCLNHSSSEELSGNTYFVLAKCSNKSRVEEKKRIKEINKTP